MSRWGSAIFSGKNTAIKSSLLNPPLPSPQSSRACCEFLKYGNFRNGLGGDIGWGYERDEKLLTCANQDESSHPPSPPHSCLSPQGYTKVSNITQRSYLPIAMSQIRRVLPTPSILPPTNTTGARKLWIYLDCGRTRFGVLDHECQRAMISKNDLGYHGRLIIPAHGSAQNPVAKLSKANISRPPRTTALIGLRFISPLPQFCVSRATASLQ